MSGKYRADNLVSLGEQIETADFDIEFTGQVARTIADLQGRMIGVQDPHEVVLKALALLQEADGMDVVLIDPDTKEERRVKLWKR
jgi:hypothetical protein